MPLLPQSPQRYLRAPRLIAEEAGAGATLHVIAWEPATPGGAEAGGERVLRFRLDATGEVLGEEDGPLLTDCVLRRTFNT